MLAGQIPGARLRTKEEIIARHGGSLERPQYAGGRPQLNRGLTKEALQEKLAFGHVLSEQQPTARGGSGGASKRGAAAGANEEDSMREAILQEIDERKEFLETMRRVGKGKEHE